MIPQNSPSKNSTSRFFIHRFQIQLCFPFQVSFREKKINLRHHEKKSTPPLSCAASCNCTVLPGVCSNSGAKASNPAAGTAKGAGAAASCGTVPAPGRESPSNSSPEKKNVNEYDPGHPLQKLQSSEFFCCHCLSISNLEEPSASSLSPPSLASRCAKAALAKSCASSRKKRTTPTFHLNCWKSHCHYLSANHNLLNGKYVKRETLRSHPSCGIP